MAFVRERIPEEYWPMLKELGVYDARRKYLSWIADKEREIFCWTVKFPNRDDRTATELLLWHKDIVLINSQTYDNVTYPAVWDKSTHKLIKKGKVIKDLNFIRIPPTLVGKEKELFKIIGDVYQHRNRDRTVSFRRLVKPEVYDE